MATELTEFEEPQAVVHEDTETPQLEDIHVTFREVPQTDKITPAPQHDDHATGTPELDDTGRAGTARSQTLPLLDPGTSSTEYIPHTGTTRVNGGLSVASNASVQFHMDQPSGSVEEAGHDHSANSMVINPHHISHPSPPTHHDFGTVEVKSTPNTLRPSPQSNSFKIDSHDEFPETSPPPGASPSPYALANKDREDHFNRLQTAHKLGALDETFDLDHKGELLKVTSSASLQNERITASTNLQNDDYYRVHKRFFRAYVRQDWHTFCVDDGLDDVRAGWVELFFDLIFVACIVHISAEAAHNVVFPGDEEVAHRRRFAEDSSYVINVEEEDLHGDVCSVGRYDYLFTGFAQFALLTSFWMEQVMYTTHFVLNEHIDELLRVFYMTFVLAMGLFVANDQAYHTGFFSSYLLLRVMSCLMFFRVLWIPRARAHALYHIILHSLIIVVLIILIASKVGSCPLDYFIIYSCLFVVEYGSGVLQWTLSDYFCGDSEDAKKKIALPLNVPHISERYGLFVMIILGEALIAIMSAEIGELDLYQKFEFTKDGQPPDVVKVFFFLGIFIMSYCIGRLYFNCQPTEEAILLGTKNHALRINKTRARLYIHSHMVLFMALLGYGIGIKLAGKYVLVDEKHWIVILLPGYSIFLIVVCLNIIRAAHPFDANKKIWIFRFIVMLILFVVPMFAQADILYIHAMIWGVQLLCILGLVATDVEGEQKRDDEQHHYDKKREAAKEHMELKKKQEEDKHPIRKHLRHLVSGIGLL